MAKKNGVSPKTHTQKQLDDYANQHNPNNKAFKARVANEAATSKKSQKNAALRRGKQQSKLFGELGLNTDLDWMCYSNPYDFD